jgi:hypothetical protein
MRGATSESMDGAIAAFQSMELRVRVDFLQHDLDRRDSKIVELEHDKRRLNTWRSIAIAQSVVIVATGAIMWIGGLI